MKATSSTYDLSLSRDIAEALAAGDDEQLMTCISRQVDTSRALDLVSEHVSRLAYVVRREPRFAQLLLIPVIENCRESVVNNADAWASAEDCLAEALINWKPPGSSHLVFRGVRPLEWIGSWNPTIMHSHLLAAVPGHSRKSIEFNAETIEWPDPAPNLGFILVVLTQARSWPQFPRQNATRDDRLQSVVAQLLNATANSQPPIVLPPAPMATAFTSGLRLWLETLHQRMHIAGWSMSPDPASFDLVRVTTYLGHDTLSRIDFPIRMHWAAAGFMDTLLRWKMNEVGYGNEAAIQPGVQA